VPHGKEVSSTKAGVAGLGDPIRRTAIQNGGPTCIRGPRPSLGRYPQFDVTSCACMPAVADDAVVEINGHRQMTLDLAQLHRRST